MCVTSENNNDIAYLSFSLKILTNSAEKYIWPELTVILKLVYLDVICDQFRLFLNTLFPEYF